MPEDLMTPDAVSAATGIPLATVKAEIKAGTLKPDHTVRSRFHRIAAYGFYASTIAAWLEIKQTMERNDAEEND